MGGTPTSLVCTTHLLPPDRPIHRPTAVFLSNGGSSYKALEFPCVFHVYIPLIPCLYAFVFLWEAGNKTSSLQCKRALRRISYEISSVRWAVYWKSALPISLQIEEQQVASNRQVETWSLSLHTSNNDVLWVVGPAQYVHLFIQTDIYIYIYIYIFIYV